MFLLSMQLLVVILVAVLVQSSLSATTTDPAPMATAAEGAFIPDRPETTAPDLQTSTTRTNEMLIELHEDDDKDSEKSSILSSINEENNFGNQNIKQGLI